MSDVGELRALSHHLRHALLGQLITVGPQTARQCAAALGDTAPNCDWHLRYLARFGLVEPAAHDHAGEAHERPWRAAVTGFWNAGDDGPADRAAVTALLRAQLSEADRLARSHLDRRHRLPPRWRAIDAISDYGLRLTAGEAEQLLGAIDALVRPYIAPTRHDAPADAEVVHLSLRAFPRPPATPPPSMT
jgi:hypothetical protein